ncbi:MAG: hypothetical protein ACRC2T_08695 [Thermoguttaceae bacterium]
MSKDARFSFRFCAYAVLLVGLVHFLSGISHGQAKPVQKNVSQGGQKQNIYSVSRANLVSNDVLTQGSKVFRYKTANFVIENAPTAEMAKFFGETAEKCKHDLAILWFGRVLPDLPKPCSIYVKVGNYGASGETSLLFDKGVFLGCEMSNAQGSRERIADSVLPHEITHILFASEFGKPLPRWLDEGLATSVEHESERAIYRNKLKEFVDPNVRRAFPFNRMVEYQKYPNDFMPFYSQSNSVAEFLIAQGGNRKFAEFARLAMNSGDWNAALSQQYPYQNLGELQTAWIDWVGDGFPKIESRNIADTRRAVDSISGISGADSSNREVTTSIPAALANIPNFERL